MAPLIQLRDVNVSLDGTPVLCGLCWRLLPGQHWAIVGRNGSGKSTFLRLIRGELSPAPGNAARRAYNIEGEEQETAVGIKEKIALVSPELQQRYLQQDWRLTGLQTVQSGFGGADYVYRPLVSKQKKAVHVVMRLLGVAALAARNVQQISTGELRRLLVARALVSSPRVLICDEICDGLDADARAVLLEALDRVARNGTQLLYATHRNEEFLPALTHRLLLRDGRIHEQGRIPGRKRRSSPLLSSQTAARSSSDGGGRRHFEARLAKAPTHGPVLIRVERANVFLGQKQVLFEIAWQLRAGEHWAFLGPNGAGKTTLLKLVCGDLHPALGGRIRRFTFTSRNSLWEVKRRIGVVSPDLQAAYRDNLNGEEVVASGFFSSIGLNERVTRHQRRRVTQVLQWLGLSALSAKRVTTMSYGEFRRILLARALVCRPAILVLDEPFDGLDAGAKAEMATVLASVAATGTSLLAVSHHVGELPACTTHVAYLAEGRLVKQASMMGLRLDLASVQTLPRHRSRDVDGPFDKGRERSPFCRARVLR